MPCGHLVICCRVGVDEAKGNRDMFNDLSPLGPEKGFTDQFYALVYLRLKHGKKQRQNLSMHATLKDCHVSSNHLHLLKLFEVFSTKRTKFFIVTLGLSVSVRFQRNRDYSSELESLAAALTWLTNWLLQQMHQAGPRTFLSVPSQAHTL